jgi:hypothetical protein
MIKYSHKIFLCVTMLLFNYALCAQANSKKQLQFHSFNSLQVLTGKTINSLSAHSVNGFQLNKLFAGIGTGFDYYYQTSVPLFLELRLDITNKERKLQAFVNAGLHIPFSNVNRQQSFKTGDFKPGRLMAAGIDYYVPVKTDAIVIGIAFSQKKLTQMVDNNVWNPVLNRIDNLPAKEVYEFNRIWMKIGWVF